MNVRNKKQYSGKMKNNIMANGLSITWQWKYETGLEKLPNLTMIGYIIQP